jgi:hypothetical protein
MMCKFRTLFAIAAAAGLLGLGAGAASASPDSSATISATPDGPGEFTYNLTLNDASDSTSAIGTFWFAWVPGEDFMGASPTNISSPSGWTEAITGGGSNDGYAIQWKATSGPSDLAAGGSLPGFSFDSSQTPAQIFGDSPFYPTTPDLTSFTYNGAPFSAISQQFVVTSVPEPASLCAVVPAVLLLRRHRRRRA